MSPKSDELTWRKAFVASPGPRTARAAWTLWLKGVCMGAADIVPGVSGGTMALITGIYENLVQAIRSVDGTLVKRLVKADFKGALAGLHIRFLLTLFCGIGLAVVSLARLMHYLLIYQAVYTRSLFFGLIVASILVVGKRVQDWRGWCAVLFAAGALGAIILVRQVPMNTPETTSFIFFSGLVAICAMILPGISGAYVLLILGKYAFITAALKSPLIPGNLLVLAVFAAGCVTGLLGFARLLNFLLQRIPNLTLAFLTGLMTGALPKIWPWKASRVLPEAAEMVRAVQEINVWPSSLDAEFTAAVALAVLGFGLVMLIEYGGGTDH